MKREDKALLMAMCLGDGYIRKSPKGLSARISFTHCEAQREYLEHKAIIINSICGGKQNEVKTIVNNGYPGCTYGKSHKYFRVLRKVLYRDGVKQYPKHVLNRLTPQGFAIWWMDDGGVCAKKRNGKIHAWCGFLNTYTNYDDSMTIANRIEEMFSVRPLLRKDKGKYRLEFNTTRLKIMLPKISSFSIPSMAYKFNLSTSAGLHYKHQ